MRMIDRYCQKLFHNKKCIYVNYAKYELHALIQVMMNSKQKKTFISGRQTNQSMQRGLNDGSDMPFLKKKFYI